MKKLLIVLILAAVLMGCKSTGPAGFSSVAGKEWKLIEVRINSELRREILFDRASLNRETQGTYYTIKFETENLGGVAAPNRFNAPYALGEQEGDISISPMRSTMMASLLQPLKLRESDFLQFMQNVYKWELVNGNLVLLTKNEGGDEIRMLFS